MTFTPAVPTANQRRYPLSTALATTGVLAVCLLAGCASMAGQADTPRRSLDSSSMPDRESVWESIVARMEERGKQTPQEAPDAFAPQHGGPGQIVLATGYRIVYEEKRVVTGSCWDFVNAVYDAAGYPSALRSTVFLGRQEGPYADPDLLQPGDWVMHRNMEFGEVEHSSIFVQWIDRDSHTARTLDYAGMNRNVTGRFSQHRYAKVFAILRPAKTH